MGTMTAAVAQDRFTKEDLYAIRETRNDGHKYELLNGSIYMSHRDPEAMFTRADLDAMPDDECRYELLNGTIIVSPPSPGLEHQRAVPQLWLALRADVPAVLEVIIAPFTVVLSESDVVQPDVMVVERSRTHRKGVDGSPLLVVEVLSPSTRARDLGEKLLAYADAGVRWYWVFDPLNPELWVRELRDGEYVEIADVSGDEEWTSEAPYAVTIRPSDLVR